MIDFTGVSREIRSLADQSIEATRQVGDVLAGLGTSIASAVKMADHGTRAIGEDLSRVRQSGNHLRGMLAITRLRSTKPGSVTPSRTRRSLQILTPLTAINPSFTTHPLWRAPVSAALVATAVSRAKPMPWLRHRISRACVAATRRRA